MKLPSLYLYSLYILTSLYLYIPTSLYLYSLYYILTSLYLYILTSLCLLNIRNSLLFKLYTHIIIRIIELIRHEFRLGFRSRRFRSRFRSRVRSRSIIFTIYIIVSYMIYCSLKLLI